jgi:hypothetical protein
MMAPSRRSDGGDDGGGDGTGGVTPTGWPSRRRFVAGALAVASSPLWCASLGTAASAAPSQGATWSSYFYPLRVGRTCQEVLDSDGVTGTETVRVAAVSRTAQGQAVTVDDASATQVNGQDIPTNSALHFLLTDRGQLVRTPSNQLVGGIGVQTIGNTVLPSVSNLMSGGRYTTRIVVLVVLPPSDLSQLQGALQPNQKDLRAAIAIREVGSVVPVLTVPLGTFHDVLKVDQSLQSISVTNARKSEAGALSSALRSELSREFTSQTWYAKDIGPIRYGLLGLSESVTSCTG